VNTSPEEIDVYVHGATGRMGRMVVALAGRAPGIRLAGFLDPRVTEREPLEGRPFFSHIAEGRGGVAVVVDFSRPEAIGPLLRILEGTPSRLVSGTTGLGEMERKLLEKRSKEAAVLYDENMSYGVSIVKRLLRAASASFGKSADVEIVEFHHRAKRDHPSGTSFGLARAIDPRATVIEGRGEQRDSRGRVIRTHSARIGGIPGEHHVYFATDDEIVTISHRALSREAFARGALRAVRFVAGKTKGFFTMEDVTPS
jgi:4-hydroxy-tetrahydrodipicolinate reductase